MYHVIECNCVNGKCNSGPDGNGECYCQPPYSGPICDKGNPAKYQFKYPGVLQYAKTL